MNITPTVKIKQPTIEQIHDHLDQALAMTGRAIVEARAQERESDLVRLERIEYELLSAQRDLPPRQLEFPF